MFDGGAAAQGDPQAVEGVEGERDEDEGPLQHAYLRRELSRPHLMSVGRGPPRASTLERNVLDEERADGDEAG